MLTGEGGTWSRNRGCSELGFLRRCDGSWGGATIKPSAFYTVDARPRSYSSLCALLPPGTQPN